MTRFRRRPSGLLVPDYEVRGFRPSAFGGRGGVFRSRGPGAVIVSPPSSPTITSISPGSGAGDDAVEIVGTNFVASGLVVTVGGVSITPNLINSTIIQGILGAHANGLVNVYVATANGNDTLVNGFTYAAAGEDEPIDPGSGYLWSNGFDAYTDEGNNILFMRDNDQHYGDFFSVFRLSSSNVNGQSLITGRGGAGLAGRCAIGTGVSGSAWHGPYGDGYLDSYSGSLVMQFWFRVSSGGTPGTAGMKWCEIWRGSGHTARVQWGLDRGTEARPLWSSVLGSNPGNNGVNRTTQPVGPFWDALNDGNWHRATHLLKLNTSTSYSNLTGTTSATETYSGTSSRDGRIAMWIDGVKILDYSQATMGVTPSGGLNQWCYQGDVDMIPAGDLGDFLSLSRLCNNSPGAFTVDDDELKIWAVA